MATDSNTLACKNPMERGAWQAMVCGITELDITERVDMHTHIRARTHICTYKTTVFLGAKIIIGFSYLLLKQYFNNQIF